MYKGVDFWDRELSKDMIYRKISDQKEILTYPDLPKNLYTSFKNSVKKSPQKTAVIDDSGKHYSYGELLDMVDRFSAWLVLETPVKKGNHAALMLYNSIEFCVAFLALNRIGAVAVPLPTKFKKDEVCSLLDQSDVTYIISDESFQTYFRDYIEKGIKICIVRDGTKAYGLTAYENNPKASEVCAAETSTDISDLALLMFTSGTTSRSKGVMIRNYNIMHAVVSYQRTLGITVEDKAIIPIPVYLITGLAAVFGLMMHVGGTVCLNRFFKAERVLSDIEKYNITFLHASPTVFTLLLEEKSKFPKLPSLRILACGSSNMPAEKIRMLHKWLPDCGFRTIYGLTETASPATVFPVDVNRSPYIGSSGIPIPGIEFKILNENKKEAEPGERGSVLVKGSNITESYYKLETSAFQEGWLDTGDIGYFNAEGYLYIADRKKDMINRGGEKVCSLEVENELSNIEGIEDCAVVGILHELYGETPAAVVRLKQGYPITEAEIRRILKKRIAGYKIPERIIFLERIPVTENLKVDKNKIRKMFE